MRPPSLWNFCGVFQEVHHLLDLLLGLIAAGHVGKGDGIVVFVQHPRLGLAEAEGPALAAALHLAHEVHPHADQQQHRPPTDQQAEQEGAFLAGLDVEFDVVVDQVPHQAAIQVGGRGADAPVIGG